MAAVRLQQSCAVQSFPGPLPLATAVEGGEGGRAGRDGVKGIQLLNNINNGYTSTLHILQHLQFSPHGLWLRHNSASVEVWAV